jgi:hypothetical protein
MPKIIRQDFHRNGITGMGFVVSLVEWPEAGIDDQLFVAVSALDDSGYGPIRKRRSFEAGTLVLNVARLRPDADGAANMWHGADDIGPLVASAWHDSRIAAQAGDPFGCGHER